jgi:hypothetical protein
MKNTKGRIKRSKTVKIIQFAPLFAFGSGSVWLVDPEKIATFCQ